LLEEESEQKADPHYVKLRGTYRYHLVLKINVYQLANILNLPSKNKFKYHLKYLPHKKHKASELQKLID
jgi:hypothetical protein